MNKKLFPTLLCGIVISIVATTGSYSYFLVPILADIFSIALAFGILLTIACNLRKIQYNHYLVLIGIAYIFFAANDLFSTLSYKTRMSFSASGTNRLTHLYRDPEPEQPIHRILDKKILTRVLDTIQWETKLRQALKRQEFQVYYQPIVSLESGKLMGFEALVRWRHPKIGMISPAKFIPVAEDTGLIIPLGEWILREACRQMQIWQEKLGFLGTVASKASTTRPSVPILSVNLSLKQFSQPNLIDRIDSILGETGVVPGSLKFELTESAIADNTSAVTTLLWELKTRNIQLSIDDFGTGYSSLSYLHRFPVDTLKIDKSFVDGIGEISKKKQIVGAIITLAHTLGMEVIAEGVETRQQLEQLQALQCEYVQGYFFSKPLDAKAAEALIVSAPQW